MTRFDHNNNGGAVAGGFRGVGSSTGCLNGVVWASLDWVEAGEDGLIGKWEHAEESGRRDFIGVE